jgi:hypothetical protein
MCPVPNEQPAPAGQLVFGMYFGGEYIFLELAGRGFNMIWTHFSFHPANICLKQELPKSGRKCIILPAKFCLDAF